MLIQKLFAPASEVSDVGLQEINMSRLGRFVALAGKNGAGKTRILKKLEFYANARLNGIDQILSWKSQIELAQNALNSDPSSDHRGSWEGTVKSCKQQMALTTERINPDAEIEKFKAIRFVPKTLTLEDPRQFASGQLLTRFAQAKLPGLDGYEQHCLFYVQQLQTRWWNSCH